jgi:large subunit ribosomal protein L23
MSKSIALKPRLNEKTYGLASSRVYVFDVDRSVNRHNIARAVESQFEVKVVKVNTANIPGKSKRVISLSGKRVKGSDGSRNDFKKAYVTLAEGQGLPFFDAIEEEEQQEQAAQEKFDKAAAKQAEKDAKADKKASKSEPKSESKPAAKPEPKKPAAKKPAAKPKDAGSAGQPAKTEPEAEQPAERKRGLAAWRGFRLRKKNKEDK